MFRILAIPMTDKGTLSNNGFTASERKEYVHRNGLLLSEFMTFKGAEIFLVEADLNGRPNYPPLHDIYVIDSMTGDQYEYDDPHWGIYKAAYKI